MIPGEPAAAHMDCWALDARFTVPGAQCPESIRPVSDGQEPAAGVVRLSTYPCSRRGGNFPARGSTLGWTAVRSDWVQSVACFKWEAF
ncbi:hypothetical protein GCM10018952_75320 [Streptosporangium vulgare]